MRKKILLLAAFGLALALVAVGILAMMGFGYTAYRLAAMNPEYAYFDSDGVRIHYTVDGVGTPVILVHGLAINGGLNFRERDVVGALKDDYQVITLDNRGHGHSDKPHSSASYGENLCDDIIRLMDHLQLEQAHVLGYSMGGFIVLKLAELYPDRLLSFACCAAGWTPRPEEEFDFFQALADELDAGRGYGMLSERLTPIGREVSRRNRLRMSVGLWLINDNKAIAALLRSMPALVVEEAALRQNEVPALALVGDRDPLRPFTEKMAEITANMTLTIVPDADHMSTLRRTEAIDAIKAHLQRHTPEATMR